MRSKWRRRTHSIYIIINIDIHIAVDDIIGIIIVVYVVCTGWIIFLLVRIQIYIWWSIVDHIVWVTVLVIYLRKHWIQYLVLWWLFLDTLLSITKETLLLTSQALKSSIRVIVNIEKWIIILIIVVHIIIWKYLFLLNGFQIYFH